MQKDQILQELEVGLNDILSGGLAPADRSSISMAVKLFIMEIVSRYSEPELLDKFSTVEKGLVQFVEYLESDCVPDTLTIH